MCPVTDTRALWHPVSRPVRPLAGWNIVTCENHISLPQLAWDLGRLANHIVTSPKHHDHTLETSIHRLIEALTWPRRDGTRFSELSPTELRHPLEEL